MARKKKNKSRIREFAGLILLAAALIALFSVSPTRTFTAKIYKNISSVFFVPSITTGELRSKYTYAGMGNDPVKILIVPGHDKKTVGAMFGSVKEEEINARLGEHLKELFDKRREVEAILARDTRGYNPDYMIYYARHEERISDFVSRKKEIMSHLIDKGEVEYKRGVSHNALPSRLALRIYGINDWANTIDADVVIHIHFNDHAGRRAGQTGKYNGFAVYVPEGQYSNAAASRELGEYISEALSEIMPESNLPLENGGVVPDQELIAIGAFNTLDPASVLIEYGYIYNYALRHRDTREILIEDMAVRTFRGVLNFLSLNTSKVPETVILPEQFDEDLEKGMKGSVSVMALQAVLKKLGHYPPSGKSLYDCPITGIFGPCTEAAVVEFQGKENIPYLTGYFGPMTRKALNNKLKTI